MMKVFLAIACVSVQMFHDNAEAMSERRPQLPIEVRCANANGTAVSPTATQCKCMGNDASAYYYINPDIGERCPTGPECGGQSVMLWDKTRDPQLPSNAIMGYYPPVLDYCERFENAQGASARCPGEAEGYPLPTIINQYAQGYGCSYVPTSGSTGYWTGNSYCGIAGDHKWVRTCKFD